MKHAISFEIELTENEERGLKKAGFDLDLLSPIATAAFDDWLEKHKFAEYGGLSASSSASWSARSAADKIRAKP